MANEPIVTIVSDNPHSVIAELHGTLDLVRQFQEIYVDYTHEARRAAMAEKMREQACAHHGHMHEIGWVSMYTQNDQWKSLMHRFERAAKAARNG